MHLGIVVTDESYMPHAIGLLDRRNRTFLRMGYDSLAAIAAYAIAIVALSLVWAAS